MQPDAADAACLLDMLTAAQAVARHVRGHTFDTYMGNEIVRDAVERKVEIIGEAARSISQAFQDAHPEVSWRPIIAQRHVLAHDYGDIDHTILWRVATIHVPRLIELLTPLLPPPPANP
jgi:uncharacterized protein with HEPN domain